MDEYMSHAAIDPTYPDGMDVTVVEVVPADWLVDVVNEFASATRAAAGEGDAAPRRPAGGPSIAGQLSDEQLSAIADLWFEVFAAPSPAGLASAINEAFGRAPAGIRAEHIGGAVLAGLAADGPVVDQVRVAGAMTLLAVVSQLGSDRLGTCHANRCVDVYIDRSPRRNRTYCSEQCQTRDRVARHRRRISATS